MQRIVEYQDYHHRHLTADLTPEGLAHIPELREGFTRGDQWGRVVSHVYHVQGSVQTWSFVLEFDD